MKTIIALFFMAVGVSSLAQSIVISDEANQTPDNSAVLDVKSDSRGMLIPRLTAAEREGITSPAKGLIIYQTDGTEGFYFNKGTPDIPNWTSLTSLADTPWQRDPGNNALFTKFPGDSVGIGTNDPGALLSANGMIQSILGGYKFPDGSVQSTAAFSPGPEGAADGRWVVAMYCAAFPGDWGYPGYENYCRLLSLDWRISSNGLRPTLNYFKIIKNIDVATLGILPYLINGNVVQNNIDFYFFWYTEGSKNMTPYFRISLVHCLLPDMRQWVVNTGNDLFAHLEEIYILFDKIRWYYLPTGSQFEWDINSPVK